MIALVVIKMNGRAMRAPTLQQLECKFKNCTIGGRDVRNAVPTLNFKNSIVKATIGRPQMMSKHCIYKPFYRRGGYYPPANIKSKNNKKGRRNNQWILFSPLRR